MAGLPFIQECDVEAHLSWQQVVEAISLGHRQARARIGDLFLTREADTLLNRAAWIDGLGIGLKTVTVMSANPAQGLPTVQGLMIVFDAVTGTPAALIDSQLVTKWKTAADSLLGALKLARPDSRKLLILGAGEVSYSLALAYSALFPGIDRVMIWNRTAANAQKLVDRLATDGIRADCVQDLPQAVAEADIVSSATMSHSPILKGEWLRPGTHVDLIGAFRPDMREADDEVLLKARIFVDCRETTLDHIGELKTPLAEGILRREDILGDLYDLEAGANGRTGPDDITVFKNGGGAHLDLMTAGAILKAYAGRQGK
ncbi:ornithine cyclodeaminase family protein [Allorhizobium undicola]|uniref:ornithine cyclodeaminase family protein n=1 Tax=Allorhizobium undicola TaxID=78527 RepID=UPI000AE66BF3|nr:ornithine cyclodeaminase [Allorhizobium undicola]